jgi:hypothetical protein
LAVWFVITHHLSHIFIFSPLSLFSPSLLVLLVLIL